MHQSQEAPYHFRLEKGEDIIEAIVAFCEHNSITAGRLEAIGAVLEAELGFYDLKRQKYHHKTFGEMEIVSLLGNIALVDDKPYIHAHVTLSGRDFSAVGGHLFKGIVGATCEVFLTPLPHTMKRKHVPSIGLKLLHYD